MIAFGIGNKIRERQIESDGMHDKKKRNEDEDEDVANVFITFAKNATQPTLYEAHKLDKILNYSRATTISSRNI